CFLARDLRDVVGGQAAIGARVGVVVDDVLVVGFRGERGFVGVNQRRAGCLSRAVRVYRARLLAPVAATARAAAPASGLARRGSRRFAVVGFSGAVGLRRVGRVDVEGGLRGLRDDVVGHEFLLS